MVDRYLHALYCDDVRQEVTGKTMLIGVYGPRMYVPGFPFVLPKLCLKLDLVTKKNNPIEKLRFRVLQDDATVIETEDLAQILKTSDSSEATDESEDKLLVYTAHFEVAALALSGPCKIKVRAETEQGELKGSALQILLAERASTK